MEITVKREKGDKYCLSFKRNDGKTVNVHLEEYDTIALATVMADVADSIAEKHLNAWRKVVRAIGSPSCKDLLDQVHKDFLRFH